MTNEQNKAIKRTFDKWIKGKKNDKKCYNACLF